MKRRNAKPHGPYLHEMILQRERVPSFDDYPFNLPILRKLHTLEFHPKVTFFIGENGSGKSTLLEAVAVGCDLNAEGGSRNFNFATRASHSDLHRYLRLSKSILLPNDAYFLRAESFYNVATEIERLDQGGGGPPIAAYYGQDPLHEQSHGESFFALFKNRLRGHGLYFMDEPEAALSPNRQLEFLALLHLYCKSGAQFVIATHSPIIMAYPDAWIYVLSNQGIERMAYEDTEHFRVTRAFLSQPQKMLRLLLAEEADEGSS